MEKRLVVLSAYECDIAIICCCALDLGSNWELAYGTEPHLLQQLMKDHSDDGGSYWVGGERSGSSCPVATNTGTVEWTNCGRSFVPICRFHLFPGSYYVLVSLAACCLADSVSAPLCVLLHYC